MRLIPLHGAKAAGRVALVDDADYALVAAYHWHVCEYRRPGGGIAGPYAMTHIYRDGKRTTVKMHQLITGWARTDHRNHDGLDNQSRNLRSATVPENTHNQRQQPGCSSRFKGVAWHIRHGKWRAQIKLAGKVHHLGYYADETEAARAYDQAAAELHGEFACLNFEECA